MNRHNTDSLDKNALLKAPFLSLSNFATVVHAKVTSRLDYSNTLSIGLPWRQLVQNVTTLAPD